MWAVLKFVLALRHNLYQPNDTGLFYFFLIYATSNTPHAPMNHAKIFKGWPLRDAPSKLVQLWYKIFPTDHGGQIEMKTPTRLSNKTSTA